MYMYMYTYIYMYVYIYVCAEAIVSLGELLRLVNQQDIFAVCISGPIPRTTKFRCRSPPMQKNRRFVD